MRAAAGGGVREGADRGSGRAPFLHLTAGCLDTFPVQKYSKRYAYDHSLFCMRVMQCSLKINVIFTCIIFSYLLTYIFLQVLR